jgi:hypothetical protein
MSCSRACLLHLPHCSIGMTFCLPACLPASRQIVNLVGGQYVGQLEYSGNTSTATWLSVMILPSFAFLRSIYLGTKSLSFAFVAKL